MKEINSSTSWTTKAMSSLWVGMSLLTAACQIDGELVETEGEGMELTTSGQAIVNENGIDVSNGLELPNGFQLPNAIKIVNGVSLKNGNKLPNGIQLGNPVLLNISLPAGINAAFAPPAGSDLERWIDSDPAMNLRVLKYLGECALPSTKKGLIRYRGQDSFFSGILGLGPGIQYGDMSTDEQEKVSSCLLARLNHSGEVITFNLIMPTNGLDAISSTEFSTYKNEESIFFGNLFQPTPAAYMCSQSTWQRQAVRACKVSDSSCSPVLKVLSCADTPNKGYCGGQGNSSKVLSACYSWGGDICTGKGLGNSKTMAQSCNWGGKTWKFPASTYVKPKPRGSACGDWLNCESGSCNFATHTCN